MPDFPPSEERDPGHLSYLEGNADDGDEAGGRVRPGLEAGLRWVHVYLSMLSFLAVLFFAITGVTLNHPEWFGQAEVIEDFEGRFPAGWAPGGQVDWIAVTEHLRAEHGVRGRLRDYRIEGLEGSLEYRGPGYSGDASFDRGSGEYRLTVARTGAVGILNDLHRGVSSGSAWSWLIDLAGFFLALVALTGIGLLLLLREPRSTGLLVVAVGTGTVFLLAMRLVS